MTTLSFDPNNTLAGGLCSMTPRDVITLGIALCSAVERAVGADGCHGGVWPGNITCADGQVAVGPMSDAGISNITPDALEFLAPEQFWSGERSPAGDVYSIGLVLYTALNGGALPFFPNDGKPAAEARAIALQDRMKGKPLPYPASAGRELGNVILTATTFYSGSRYATPGQMKAALQALSEGADIPAAAPVLPLSQEQLKNAHSYKVDKHFETTAPEKNRKPVKREKKLPEAVDENMDAAAFRATPKKKSRFILPVILIVVIIVAICLLLRGCKDYYDPDFPVSSAPIETTGMIHAPVPTGPLPVTSSAPGTTGEPEQPTETDAPAETVPPAETEVPQQTPSALPTYELFMADVTWEQAKDLCDQKGGHLATVRNDEQFNAIVALAEANGARFVWLGAYRAENAQWYYVTGDTLDYAVWDTGEPSAQDADGTREDYLLLWYRKSVGTWSYNDMRNDPISVVPKTYSGKTCYICQYD